MKLLYLGIILSSYQLFGSVAYDMYKDRSAAAKEWPYVKKKFPYAIQSPTDIETCNAKPLRLKPIRIHLLRNMPDDAVYIENTGYYLEVHMNEDLKERPYVKGGPLMKDKFILEQMHFHWGSTDECGSEHWIDRTCYACEIHVVHYNEKYGSYDVAKDKPDGIAVISFFGKAVDKDNPQFGELMEDIPKVIEPESKVPGSFRKEFQFLEILFQQETYYSVPGSLTTDPYYESVTWIFYTNPFEISHRQLAQFRTLRSEDGDTMITHNYRELQPFNDRPIITPLLPGIPSRCV